MAGRTDENDIAIKSREDRIAGDEARDAFRDCVFRIGKLDTVAARALGGHTVGEALGRAMPEQCIANAAEQRVFNATPMTAATARFAQEQGLVGHHATAHLVGSRAHFHAAINLTLRQNNRVGAHFGEYHRLGGLEGLGCEHLHAHRCGILVTCGPSRAALTT